MTIRILLALLTVGSCWSVRGQASPINGDVSCAGLEKDLAALSTTGVQEADAFISVALSKGKGTCVGLALANLAAAEAISKRPHNAERLADRSIKVLEMSHPGDAAILLRPLQILCSTSLDSGHVSTSRRAYDRMLQVATDSPEDRFLVRLAAARLLDKQERYKDAETNIRAAMDALREARGTGQGDEAALLTSLALIQIKLHRYGDARMTIERALSILELAKDAGPIDRVDVLHARAILRADTRQWQGAAEDLHDAVALIQAGNRPDSALERTLLLRYGNALRHIHRRQEARVIEKRAAALTSTRGDDALVDVSEFDSNRKNR